MCFMVESTKSTKNRLLALGFKSPALNWQHSIQGGYQYSEVAISHEHFLQMYKIRVQLINYDEEKWNDKGT